jgi:hypothetical protein
MVREVRESVKRTFCFGIRDMQRASDFGNYIREADGRVREGDE